MGPVRQNPIQRTVRSAHMCASHCAQLLHTVLHRTDVIIFPLTPCLFEEGAAEYPTVNIYPVTHTNLIFST